jgi:hypothetical protein
VTALPASLTRWRRQLEPFPEELAVTLGKLVQRLAPSVDAFAASRNVEQGEIDGFDGIGNRGSYERLLSSEWLLREQFPLEFWRRAANAEHSFFRLAHRAPAPKQPLLVLFDAGPDQLGGCRLAQLALLVLLVQRAEQQKQRFGWQLLHHIGVPPLGTLNEQSVRTFLGSRHALRTHLRALESWRAQYSAHELWLVGPKLDVSAPIPSSVHIAISERVSPTDALLDVTLRGAGHRTREVVLELPEPRQAVRLIRNPFEVPRASLGQASVPGLASNFLLNDVGTKLAYADPRGDLLILPVPSSFAEVGQPRRYEIAAGKRLISATALHKKLFWLCHAEGVLTLHSNDARGIEKKTRQAKCVDPFPAGENLGALAWFPDSEMATFVAPDTSLWRIDFRTNVARAIAGGVTSVLNWRAQPLVVVIHSLEMAMAAPSVLEVGHFNAHLVFDTPATLRARLLRGVDIAAGKWLLGLDNELGVYRVQLWEYATREQNVKPRPAGRMLREVTLHPPSGATVIAVDYDSRSQQIGLVALDEARRELFVVGRNHARTLLKTQSDIEQVVAAAAAPLFAFATKDGELGVIDRSGQARFRKVLAPR